MKTAGALFLPAGLPAAAPSGDNAHQMTAGDADEEMHQEKQCNNDCKDDVEDIKDCIDIKTRREPICRIGMHHQRTCNYQERNYQVHYSGISSFLNRVELAFTVNRKRSLLAPELSVEIMAYLLQEPAE